MTNTGNVTLSNVGITETAFSGTGILSAITCPSATLAVGDHEICTATYAVTQTDINAGSVTNTAVAHGTAPGTTTPTDSGPSSASVTATPAPALTILKSANPSTVTTAGTTVTYSFLVTNTGNVTLSNVNVTETAFSGAGTMSAISCPATMLAPNAHETCTATYLLTQADIDAGKITNTAVAHGTAPNATTPTDSGPSTASVTAAPAPALTVVKTANPTTVTAAGSTVTYSFVVTNTGNVTLSNVNVTETAFSGSGAIPVISCPSQILAPGAVEICSATYTVTQADMDGGKITNTAVAHGTPPGTTTPVNSPPSTAVVTPTATPGISVVKSVSPSGSGTFGVGQQVTYLFVVTNTGNVTLSNVSVDEQSFSGSRALSPVSCPTAAASLAPGKQVTCTATYTVTQADVDAGKITNTAIAVGTPPGTTTPIDSPPSSVTVPEAPHPAITVIKSANRNAVTKAGDTITYSFLVTNTGNVTLSNVTVDEQSFSGSGTLTPVSCPATSLAPGGRLTCTASYTVTQADIDGGKITNTAIATGTPPGSTTPVDSPPSSVTVKANPFGKLAIVKKAHPIDVNGDGLIDQGDQIDWTVIVTNVGQATITDIVVSDPTAGAVHCPSTSLAPGASMTCTAPPHTVTAADAAAGRVRNVATALGRGPGGQPVTSPPATATAAIAGIAISAVTSTVTTTRSTSLAFTGAYTTRLVVVGLGLLMIGALLLVAGLTRRRRESR